MGLSKLFRRGDPADDYVRTADERALVRRLDTFLLTFGCLSQGTTAYGFKTHCMIKGLTGSSDQIP